MKKIVLTTILLASLVSWAQADGPKERGGGVTALGHDACCEQESLPATLSDVDQPPGATMPQAAGAATSSPGNGSKKNNAEQPIRKGR